MSVYVLVALLAFSAMRPLEASSRWNVQDPSKLVVMLVTTLVLHCDGYLRWNEHDPGKEKFHHYKLHPRHSAGFSDEWLGMVQSALELDYSQVPITDPDPRDRG